jgi:hypothetical protein
MAATRAAELTVAYKTLTDPALREEYYATIDSPVAVAAPQPPRAAPAEAFTPPPAPPQEPDRRTPIPPGGKARFAAERADRDVILKRAIATRVLGIVEGLYGKADTPAVRGFDLAIVPRAKPRFLGSVPPRVLIKVVEFADAQAITESFTAASRSRVHAGKSPEVGGYLAVRHLIDLGHRDIAVVTGPSFTSTGIARLAGARRALDEARLTARDEWIIAGGYGIENGFSAGEALLGAVVRPTAVFAANDNIAMGIMAAAHRQDLRVGADLALVGYNDTPLAARLPTPLTSVHVPLDQIARTAIDLIVEPGKEPLVRTSMPTLIPRESSGPGIRGGAAEK